MRRWAKFTLLITMAGTLLCGCANKTIEDSDPHVETSTADIKRPEKTLAGTLMEVGRRNIEPESIPDILRALDRTKAGPTAPACGLTLVKYQYDDNILPEEKAVTVHK